MQGQICITLMEWSGGVYTVMHDWAGLCGMHDMVTGVGGRGCLMQVAQQCQR